MFSTVKTVFLAVLKLCLMAIVGVISARLGILHQVGGSETQLPHFDARRAPGAEIPG